MFIGLQEGGPQNVVVIDKAGLVTNKLKAGDDITFYYQAEDLSDSAFKASPYTTMVHVNEKVINNTADLLQGPAQHRHAGHHHLRDREGARSGRSCA